MNELVYGFVLPTAVNNGSAQAIKRICCPYTANIQGLYAPMYFVQTLVKFESN